MLGSMRFLLLALCAILRGGVASDFPIELRSRVELFKGSGDWRETHVDQSLNTSQTAVLICDMWDKHWCQGATERVGRMVKPMNELVEAARSHGIQIIHSPSETMKFYEDMPQRKLLMEIPRIQLPAVLDIPDHPLPIDDTRGGCDTHDKFSKAWTREHAGLRIAESDVVSDNGDEIYSFLRSRGIRTLLVMGVHTNMCVLNRTFAIKKMTSRGIRCILVRDMTDAMYDPQARPFVSHDQGTQLVIEHIEKYWCPTTTSAILLRAFQQLR